jgi:hypothetical protein
MWLRQWLSFFTAVFGSTRRAVNHFPAQVSTSASGRAPPRRGAVRLEVVGLLLGDPLHDGSVNRFRCPLGSRTT